MLKSRAKEQAKAMAHQLVSLKHDKTTPLVFDCSDPGTGKTFVRIMAFAERRRKRGGKALVLATKSLLKTAWYDDFKKFAPDMKVSIARAENREAAFAADADVYVTNHDAVVWLAKQNKAFFAKFSELIIDESTAFKHHTSQRSRSLAKIRAFFNRRSCLTGTPNSRSITDVWHQVFLLDDGKRLGNNFYSFRNHVTIPRQVGRSANAIEWIDKPGAEEAVFGLLGDIVIRHRFEDCVDIPENHEFSVEYELTPKQRKAYAEMEANAMLMLQQGSLTAINAAAVVTKMLQICSGAVYDNERLVHLVDDSRYDMVLDLVEERIDRRPLVFFYWQHQREALVAKAGKRGIKYAVLDGSVSTKDRDAAVMMYQAGNIDAIFAHPQSAAHGITMTRGSSTIWTGPTYNAEWYKQGSKRQYRIGQKLKTENVMVIAKDTREEQVYEVLLGKNSRMKTLLDLFETTKEVL